MLQATCCIVAITLVLFCCVGPFVAVGIAEAFARNVADRTSTSSSSATDRDDGPDMPTWLMTIACLFMYSLYVEMWSQFTRQLMHSATTGMPLRLRELWPLVLAHTWNFGAACSASHEDVCTLHCENPSLRVKSSLTKGRCFCTQF